MSVMVGGDRVLDRNRSAGGRHRGDEQGRDMICAEYEPSCGCGRPAGAGDDDTATGCRATGRGTASRAAGESQDLGDDSQRADDGSQRRQLARDAAKLAAEAPAPRAVADVPSRDGVRPYAPVVGIDQLFPDLRAGGVARLGGAGQREPRPHQQRLHRWDRDPERAGEIGVGHARELAHQQRRALLIREPADVLDQPPQRLAQVDLHLRIHGVATQQRQHLRRRWGGSPELIDTAVVRHPEQPRAQGELAIAGTEPGVRANEDIL
jgi:hypothetical protein